MNFTGNKVLNKIVAIFAIITMTLSDFLFAGANIVSYAIDSAKTNVDNVEFSCYFVDSNSNKVEKDIDASDIKMHVEISVKNEGYLSGGKITLGNSNFKIKDKILSEDVARIESNTIYLGTIKAGKTSLIEVEVENNLPEVMSASQLNTVSEVVLEGSYTNSKKTQDILGKANIEVDWKSGESTKAESTLDVLTNKVFEINGQSKRIVQLLVTSKLTNNNYPVKNTKININASQGAEEVTVEARDTSATNGNKGLQNYEYNKEDGSLRIDVVNNDTSSISFKRNAIDEFIVTYVYPEEFEANGTEYISNTVIVPYDNKEKIAEENKVTLSEIKDGTVTYSIESSEKEMYKGKIYTGEPRSYESTTKINVNKVGIANKIDIYEINAGYQAEVTYGANILYSKTKVSKNEFSKVYGTDGYIIFKDKDGNEIAKITNASEVDGAGYINITYPENTREVKMETSRPVSEGTVNIINTKTIKETSYDREKVKSFEYITEHIQGKYDEEEPTTIENKITLKDTSSKATLDVTNKSFSTTEKTNTRITVILETDTESKDLYKNPTVKVTLPKQVKAFEFKYKLIHGNGLEIADKKIITEGENNVIVFTLTGEQTKYVTDITEGATLVIDLAMELDSLAVSSSEEIKVNYTNEFTNTYMDNGEEKVQVNIIAKNSLIMASKINELKVTTSPTEEKKDIELEVDSDDKVLTQTMDIVNNETNKITDIKILGTYPTNNSKNNMGITLNIPASSITKKGEKIYYSTEEHPTADLTNASNKWTEKYSENDKSYLIVIDSLEVAEKFSYGIKMNIPANLKHNLSAETGYTVSYKNEATNTEKTATATTVEFNTGKVATIEQKLVATVGNEEIKDGDVVKSGEIITYKLTVANTGNEDATGVSIVGNIPEGTNYIEYNKIEKPTGVMPEDEPEMFKEDLNKKQVKFENQTIKAKSEKTFEYMVKVNTNTSIQSQAKITISDGNKINLEGKINHKIENSGIEATMKKSTSIYSDELKSGYNNIYVLNIKNTSNKEMNNIKVVLDMNELHSLERVYYTIGEETTEETKKEFTVSKLAAGEELNIMISTNANQPTDKIKSAEISATVLEGNDKYRTNKITEKVDAIELEIEFTSETNSKAEGYLHKGDIVQYKLNIKNVGKNDATKLEIRDQFSDYLELESITLNNQKAEYTKNDAYGEGVNYSILDIKAPLKVGETANVVIAAKVSESLNLENITKIVNIVTLYNEVEISKTNEIVYFIEKTSNEDLANGSEDGEEEENNNQGNNDSSPSGNTNNDNQNENNKNSGNNGNNGANNSNNNSKVSTYTITGTAWKDTNENGSRDQGEELLADINVRLIDIQNKKYLADASGNEVTAKTNSEGLYNITNIPTGKYIVVFEYDTAKYMLTTYKADGVASDRNSDAILNTITINGTQTALATSDTLDIQNSIANIDIGLLDAKVFDLELEKYISKIVVTNNEGTSTYDYTDATLAKTDIAAKNLKDSQVVVEYTIKVKNVGEIAGYAKNIVDYKSTEFSFSSTLNKDWYAQGDNLYNASLANTKIEPGETKELKLILTKNMTESNTGLIANTAEISEAYNTRGATDKDSTPGNKANKEDDMGQADLIIGVKTGAAISYVLITLSIIAVIGVAGYLVSKKVLSKEIKFE